MKVYITFGQVHAHNVNGKTFDKDCVAVIHCDDYNHGRRLAFEHFGDQWCFAYDQAGIEGECPGFMKYFPRGLIHLNCPHEKTKEVYYEDGWPSGDIATLQCLECGHEWKTEVPQ